MSESQKTLPRAVVPKRTYNPITVMGFSAMFIYQLDILKGKHCRHPITVMGVVDTFQQCITTALDKVFWDSDVMYYAGNG